MPVAVARSSAHQVNKLPTEFHPDPSCCLQTHSRLFSLGGEIPTSCFVSNQAREMATAEEKRLKAAVVPSMAISLHPSYIRSSFTPGSIVDHPDNGHAGHLNDLLSILSTEASNSKRIVHRTQLKYHSSVIERRSRIRNVFPPSSLRHGASAEVNGVPSISGTGLDPVTSAEMESPKPQQTSPFNPFQSQDFAGLGISLVPAAVRQSLYTTDPSIYTNLCQPLSRWIAKYIWKVSTTGMSLPREYASMSRPYVEYPSEPRPVLAESICSLLLSTLLQPSVVVLALHYIARLPALLGPLGLDEHYPSVIEQFSVTFSGVDVTVSEDVITTALYSCFKLFVTGAILSNKVLDDHVFTLKTWHEVSGIPLNVLNKLEWLSLEILDHKLYIDPEAWSEWVHTLRNYNDSLISPCRELESLDPASSNDLVYWMLTSLAESCSGAVQTDILVEPVFLGISDRIQCNVDGLAENRYSNCHPFELDEDGPLREEYIPRRRSTAYQSEGKDREGYVSPLFTGSPSSHASSKCLANMPKRHSGDAVSWPPTPLDSSTYTGRSNHDCGTCEADLCPIRSELPIQYTAFDRTLPSVAGSAATLCDYFLSRTRMQEQTRPPWISTFNF